MNMKWINPLKIMYTELVKTLPLSYIPAFFYMQDENMKWKKVDIDAVTIEDVATKVNGHSQYDFFIRGSYANVYGHIKFYIKAEGRWVLYITGVPKHTHEPYKKRETETTLYCEDQKIGYLIQVILPIKVKETYGYPQIN